MTDVSESGADRSVAIHHERISAFQGRDGKSSAMPSMKMVFGVARDVPRAIWRTGQKVEFDFDVRWQERPALWIVRANTLPDATELTLDASEH